MRISIMKCNFHTITKKELFVAKLSNIEIDFGFIPKQERKEFVNFCKINKLVIPFPGGFTSEVYRANSKFRYEITYSGNLFQGLCERIAEHTGFYKRYLFTKPFIFSFATNETFRIGPRPGPAAHGLNWLWCKKDIIF